jgi:hypothetical protein
MSKDEITTIKNNGAIVSNPDEKKQTDMLTDSQIETLIKALGTISFKQKKDTKEDAKEDDSCLTVNKLKYENNSCYVDSVLFTLLAFPTPFVERYLLDPNIEEIEVTLRSIKIGSMTFGETLEKNQLTEVQIKKVMAYIKHIHQILIEINNHFRGTKRMNSDYCRNLRPFLLKDPLLILKDRPEYVFDRKKQEDAGEFVQALFKTFFIDTITFISTKYFSNSIDSSIPDYIRDNVEQRNTPFFAYTPDELQTKQFEINKNTITQLELDDYFFGDRLTNSKFKSNKLRFETLKKVQQRCILKEMLETLKKKNKKAFYTIKNKPDEPEYKKKMDILVDKIFNNKDLEILQEYTLTELENLYAQLKYNSGLFFTKELLPMINKFKKDETSCYYQAGLEIIKQYSVYYDTLNDSEIYQLDNLEESKLIVLNVKRFKDFKEMSKKDTRAIEIPEQVIITDTSEKQNITLRLNQMVIHNGTTTTSGHYNVRFRCKDKWYLYDDMGPRVELFGKLGTLQEIIQNDDIKRNCTLLIYSNINPTI